MPLGTQAGEVLGLVGAARNEIGAETGFGAANIAGFLAAAEAHLRRSDLGGAKIALLNALTTANLGGNYSLQHRLFVAAAALVRPDGRNGALVGD